MKDNSIPFMRNENWREKDKYHPLWQLRRKKEHKSECTKNCQNWFLVMAPGASQKNNMMEQGFATLYSQMHAMIFHTWLNKTSISGYYLNTQYPQIKSKILWWMGTKKKAPMIISMEICQNMQNTLIIWWIWEYYTALSA